LSLFITFEGGEGCGKTFQSRILFNKLFDTGISAELTFEPGGTALGDKLRDLLKDKRKGDISPEAELFLFASCRVQLVADVILPGLRKGKVMICDRFTDSTLAYQGYGRGIDFSTIETINRLVTRGIKPDITILLDVLPEEGLKRKHRKTNDRFEMEELDFHNRVREGYLALASNEPERWLIINGSLSKAKISETIWDQVSTRLS